MKNITDIITDIVKNIEVYEKNILIERLEEDDLKPTK